MSATVMVQILYHPGRDQPHVTRLISYLVRPPKGPDGGPSRYVTPDGLTFDRDAFESALWTDPWLFAIVFSPAETPPERSLEAMCRTWMRQVEATLARPLAWVGSEHYDSPVRHCHVLLRGRDTTGKPLTLRRHFIAHTLRELADTVEGWYT